MKGTNKLYAYGTLRMPNRVHAVLGHDRWTMTEETVTLEGFGILEGNYRYAYRDETKSITDGLVISGLTKKDMDRMDGYEAVYADLYRRDQAEIEGIGKVWVYVASPRSYQRLISGQEGPDQVPYSEPDEEEGDDDMDECSNEAQSALPCSECGDMVYTDCLTEGGMCRDCVTRAAAQKEGQVYQSTVKCVTCGDAVFIDNIRPDGDCLDCETRKTTCLDCDELLKECSCR